MLWTGEGVLLTSCLWLDGSACACVAASSFVFASGCARLAIAALRRCRHHPAGALAKSGHGQVPFTTKYAVALSPWLATLAWPLGKRATSPLRTTCMACSM